MQPAADRLVFVSVLICFLAADLLTHGGWLKQIGVEAAAPAHRVWVGAGVIGMAVGFAELVARYRDAPWRAALSMPGCFYIAANGLAALSALYLISSFPESFQRPKTDTGLALMAGTGAMVAIRSKLFTIHQASGPDVAFGPAFLVDTLLAAVNREVDRGRALARIQKVARKAAALKGCRYENANDFLIASLAAFQNMDADVTKKLAEQLQALVDDPKLNRKPDEIRFWIAGYSILTEFGDQTFDAVFGALTDYLVPSR